MNFDVLNWDPVDAKKYRSQWGNIPSTMRADSNAKGDKSADVSTVDQPRWVLTCSRCTIFLIL